MNARETQLNMAVTPVKQKMQLIEVSVFLFLIGTSILSSYLVASPTHLHFVALATSSILADLSLLSLVLYFVWRNGEARSNIGWTLRSWGREVGWGIVLFPPIVIVVNLLENALHAAGLSAPTKLPSSLSATGPGGVVLALVLVAVVAVVEETIFRGYLILRLQTVTGRTGAAVVLSSVIFSLGHGYEGMAGVISVFVMGLILGVVYLWRRSLVAPIVIHFLVDFMSIVLVALLNLKQ